MTGCHRDTVGRKLAVDDMEIGAAHPARDDLDEDLISLLVRHRFLDKLDPMFFQIRRPCLHALH